MRIVTYERTYMNIIFVPSAKKVRIGDNFFGLINWASRRVAIQADFIKERIRFPKVIL